ncbi:MFS transporter [Jonesia quinghaiensis]|uniref:MFS transporter n=1 Tax=Jonesia quinghaiensis TaxID=262806 RepID=UPI0003FCF383|nr:MFS transporter [Jonesia quinghaiensis]
MSDISHTLSRSEVARFATGSLGTGGFGALPGLVLVYFLTDTLAVTALMAGAILALAKVWDVIIDPIIGAASDADYRRTGSRRRFMLLGAFTLPVFFALTFAVPPMFGPAASAVWVLLAFVGCATTFSLFQVPYIGLPAEMTNHYDERTRLLTWRVVVLTVAILLFGGGGPVLRELGGDNARLGYVIMAVVAGLVMGIGFFVAARSAPRHPVTTSGVTAPAPGGVWHTYRAAYAVLRDSQPFRVLLATFLIQGLGIGAMLAGAQYVAKWVLGSELAVTLLFVALIAPALAMAPVWQRVARRVGKERGFLWASLIFMVASASLVFLTVSAGLWLYLPVAFCGVAYAGMQSLPMAMLPDVISHEDHARPDSRAGIFGGVWTAGETTGMALGAVIFTAVLTVTGYIESAAGVDVTQPEGAITGIIVAFSILPALCTGLSLLFLRRYRLRRNDFTKADQ